ncbi:DUF6906 family protein [uncultured Robinsoniella sp.]|uniref:DUF6906 family protein n=1 Tax=uncultured Robinsoniella sp. TaxID=904190 RepID=UPI002048E6BC|nr:MAG TPA: hypothetical protein [Caudoviricetes sp.]
MKQPKKLTRVQKQILMDGGYNWHDYMYVSETDFYLKVIHKKTGILKNVSKFPAIKKVPQPTKVSGTNK